MPTDFIRKLLSFSYLASKAPLCYLRYANFELAKLANCFVYIQGASYVPVWQTEAVVSRYRGYVQFFWS